MKTRTSAERYNKQMHGFFDRARQHKTESLKMPLEYAAGSIGNAQNGCVAMLPRGAWGYDDEMGRLLAAAPDLLTAAKMLADVSDHKLETLQPAQLINLVRDLRNVSSAAIASATGKGEQ